MQAANLADGAAQLLALFQATLPQIPEFTGLPDLQFVAPGTEIAWDGELFCVGLGEIAQGNPGAAFGGTYVPASNTVLYATFNVELVRKIAALTDEGAISSMLPDPEDLTTSALQLISDAQSLVAAAIAIHASYAFTRPGEGFVIGACTPIGPQGGMAGTKLPISVSVT